MQPKNHAPPPADPVTPPNAIELRWRTERAAMLNTTPPEQQTYTQRCGLEDEFADVPRRNWKSGKTKWNQ